MTSTTRTLAEKILDCFPSGTYALHALLQLLEISESRDVETAAVECRIQPKLLVNPDFVATWAEPPEKLLMLIMHELHHVLLGHTRLFSRPILDLDDPRIGEWWGDIERIMENDDPLKTYNVRRRLQGQGGEPPEPHCAWYCPIHFFGHGWGIYIRESCILSHTKDIASFVNWREVRASHSSIALQLLRSAFYVFFLHEQFHHKVESLGFRLLISAGSDRYRPYKAKVYRASYLTRDCLEESLANAESYRRLSEPRYTKRADKPIRDGLREFLKATIPEQPPGYAEGAHYLTDDTYRNGLYKLQSEILDGAVIPTTPAGHWSIAPNMITALADITDDIYVVLPRGARPIFRPTSVDPGVTVSTSALAGALTKHYGYEHVSGGKGSHVKLKKPGWETIILPGNRPVLSPGVVKQALKAIGGHPISRLRDILDGRLPANG